MKFFEMTREEANQILDQVRDGVPHTATFTLKCLYLTGDRKPHASVRGERVDQEIPPENWGSRIRARQIMVGASQIGHREKAGQSGIGLIDQTNERGAS
jgi:hypothetical protein